MILIVVLAKSLAEFLSFQMLLFYCEWRLRKAMHVGAVEKGLTPRELDRMLVYIFLSEIRFLCTCFFAMTLSVLCTVTDVFVGFQ